MTSVKITQTEKEKKMTTRQSLRDNAFRSVFIHALITGACAAVFFAAAVSVFAEESGKPGLLILTHGAPSPKWQESIKDIAARTAKLNEAKGAFHAVTAANMEFAQPDAAEGVRTLEKAGCDRIIVVPAFIGHTSHTHFDVPASLGLYSSPSVRKTMELEKVKPAAPKVPVTVTQPLCDGDVLDKYVKDEIAALSENPADEAVLLLAHGDEQYAGLFEPVMRRLLIEAAGSKGITVGDWLCCGMGESWNREVAPVIRKMAKDRKRVIVIGFYLVSSAKSISRAGERRGPARPAGGTANETAGPERERRAPLEGIDVRFSERGVIEHPYVPQWILQSASEAL